MAGSTPSVDNDLLSSLVETLLVFEHLFDTRYRGVSRVVGRVKQWGWWSGAVGLAVRRDRKSAILLPLSRFWKPIAQASTFLETKSHVAALLEAPPPLGYPERGDPPKRFPKT